MTIVNTGFCAKLKAKCFFIKVITKPKVYRFLLPYFPHTHHWQSYENNLQNFKTY